VQISRWLTRSIALVYLAGLLVVPVGMVFWNSFHDGVGPLVEAVARPAALSALGLTLLIGGLAIPANAVFGAWCGLQLVRGGLPRPLSVVLNTTIDIPFVISDVVVGLALLTLYGRASWLGEWLAAHGISIVFAVPGMVLATMFISLPFVVREVVPVLKEHGMEQEQAAATLGASSLEILWRITLPSMRRAIAYGVVLTTARVLGEYGAVSVVSGGISGQTQTLTLLVDERFQSFDLVGAYAASVVLAVLALGTLVVMRRLSADPAEQST
jgi:sulfate transport system permease protein